ncbi:MAG: leucine-rich repeat domain-containing protein, partial [Oscillospiraceae bacterium]|nr:leucine-rich repeat domain-containing protein [Oscillospiraceae bacterium]
MKLTRYTSALAAFLLLTSAAQSLPVSAVSVPAVRSGIAAEEGTAPADDAQKPLAEGTIGETITWVLDAEGTLTITGSGDMASVSGNLFDSNTGKIRKAVIQNTDSKKVITAIGDALFKNCSALTDVTIPDTVTAIGSEAFKNCTALQTVALPATLKEIGSSAFSGSGLTEAVLPGCAIGKAAFFGCASLKTLTIGEGTEILPEDCFRKCTALESAVLPDSLKSIECGGYSEQGAFSECIALKKVSIGKGIESIHQNAFRTTGEGLEVTFREGVTAVPESSFRNRTELVKVTLPDTLTAIGAEAFSGCSALSDCVFPESLKEIGNSAFSGSGLPEAILPGCAIGKAAFYNCASLKTLTIGEGTEILPEDCFRKCTALESAVLPDSLKSIECGGYSEQGAFSECIALKKVSIGKGIESIHQNAFRTTG